MSKSSFRNRVGNVMRRSSTAFSIPRPSTPSASDSDAGSLSSLKQLDTAPLAPPPPLIDPKLPSPIAESPAREAQALEPEPVGPSPLAGESVTQPAEPTILVDKPTGDAPVASEPILTVSPPTINEIPPTPQYVAGPGAFTDEPVSQPIEAPSEGPHQESASALEAERGANVVETAPAEPSTTSYFNTPAPGMVSPPAVLYDEPNVWIDDSSSKAAAQALNDGDASVNRSVTSKPSTSSLYTTGTKAQDPSAPLPSQSARASQLSLVPIQTIPIVESAPQGSIKSGQASLVPSGQKPLSLRQASPNPSQVSLTPSVKVVAPSIANPSQLSLASSAREAVSNQAKEATPSVLQSNGGVSYGHSDAPIIQMPVEDPFADLGPHAIPPISVMHEDDIVNMPKPEHTGELPFSPREGYDEGTPGHVLMPLPARHEVMVSDSIRSVPSEHSLRRTTEQVEHETDERRPLLSRPATVEAGRSATSYLQANPSEHVSVSPLGGNSVKWPTGTPMLHTLGWIEYVLPDGSFYYLHPTHRVITDVNLRTVRNLEAVGEHVDRMNMVVPAGLEVWLKDAGSAKRGFAPMVIWIDHKKRLVSFDPPSTDDEDTRGRHATGEDRLDMEYRYWSFMEAHPAHSSLPHNARVEAMDALTWSYTDRLLPTHRPVPPPFTQEECQELMTMLRSFGVPDNSSESGIQTVVHTRIVARILLRVATWRQRHFRSHKPLPLDTTRNPWHRPHARVSFPRRVSDFLVSVLCLGVPFLFAERVHHHRIDEESGLRSTGSMLVIGACACLVAAIVLSASVTFLSLPGLDNITRLAGFVAILCSTASMASSVIALFRYKADMERAISHLGGEGLLTLSRRSVMMSLPLVFLAYAVAAFVTGIALYSFRGASLTEPAYTRWTVVGLIGGLVGVLTTSALLARR